MDVEISTTSGGCGCTGCLSSMFSLVLAIGISSFVLVVIHQSHQGSDQAAIEAFEACPAITAELGAPLERVPWSMSCGEYEGSGNRGVANWNIPVRGPKGQASGWYSATYTGNSPWVVDTAHLTLSDGRTVQAVPCEGGRPAPSPPARERPRPDRERKGGGQGGERGGKSKGGKSKGGKGKRR